MPRWVENRLDSTTGISVEFVLQQQLFPASASVSFSPDGAPPDGGIWDEHEPKNLK